MIKPSKLKVAIVYDHLNTKYGGAELVLQNLLKKFPQADFFTSIYNPKKATWLKNYISSNKTQIYTTFLQKIPILNKNHRFASLFMPLAFEQLDLNKYQLVISVSGQAAKGIITNANQLHINYMLTPARFLYSHKTAYLKSRRLFQLPGIKQLAKGAFNYLKWWDQAAAWRPDKIIAISNLAAQRCKNYYHRPADEVIYPPVKILPMATVKYKSVDHDFYLIITRLVAYKKIDLAIKACIQSRQALKIIGSGPEYKKLQKLIKKYSQDKIELLGQKNETQKYLYLANCKALILPGIEDFGITGLEANAAGKPVILHQKSGAAEVVCGIKIKRLTVKAYTQAFAKLNKIQFSSNKLQKKAAQYSQKKFQQKFSQSVKKHVILKIKGNL